MILAEKKQKEKTRKTQSPCLPVIDPVPNRVIEAFNREPLQPLQPQLPSQLQPKSKTQLLAGLQTHRQHHEQGAKHIKPQQLICGDISNQKGIKRKRIHEVAPEGFDNNES